MNDDQFELTLQQQFAHLRRDLQQPSIAPDVLHKIRSGPATFEITQGPTYEWVVVLGWILAGVICGLSMFPDSMMALSQLPAVVDTMDWLAQYQQVSASTVVALLLCLFVAPLLLLAEPE